MKTAQAFYSGGSGDRLIDPGNYPTAVLDFLQAEVRTLETDWAATFGCLCEVGCMQGRYLSWAFNTQKKYIGIDVISRYIKEGIGRAHELGFPKKRFQFICGTAEELAGILAKCRLAIPVRRCLVFFPFNSIGNMDQLETILTAVKKSGVRFLISTYQTTHEANAWRAEYYRRCQYQNLRLDASAAGATFTSSDGLKTTAYHPDFFLKVCDRVGLPAQSCNISRIGIAYHSAV